MQLRRQLAGRRHRAKKQGQRIPSMTKSFKTVALIGKADDARVAEPLVVLAQYLGERGVRIVVEPGIELDFGKAGVDPLPQTDLVEAADLVIAVGGDGTMLYAARLVAASGVPLLGVNRGRLGFLADVSPAEMLKRLDEVLAGKYQSETRLILNAALIHADGSTISELALNDVVLQKWQTGRMLVFDTYINDCHVNTHAGDGMIIATATGSTAYALSAGGPIIQPELDAVVLLPICPHTLTDRPLVVGPGGHIVIILRERYDTTGEVTCDGRVLGGLGPADKLHVTRAGHTVTLIHPPGYDYYRILRSKLHWGRSTYSRSDETPSG